MPAERLHLFEHQQDGTGIEFPYVVFTESRLFEDGVDALDEVGGIECIGESLHFNGIGGIGECGGERLYLGYVSVYCLLVSIGKGDDAVLVGRIHYRLDG